MTGLQGLAAVLTPAGLLWTVAIIGVATFLHELAHYALARWQGVAVHSFSVGMGPVLLRREWRGTQWRLSLLPIGGYVEIDGMAPTPGPDGTLRPPAGGFAALGAPGKIAILLAGPLVNLLLAIALMTVTFTSQGVPATDRARIESVVAGSPAQELGLQAGDVITAVDGRDLPPTATVQGRDAPGYELVPDTLGRAGRHVFTVERTGGTVDLTFDWVPTVNGQRQLLGISYGPDVQPASLPAAFATSWRVTAQAVPQVVQAFAGLLTRFLTLDLSRDEGVSGPVGTAEIVSQAEREGPWALVRVATLLNLSLAFFNLIPIPGLDGGRILLVLVGALRGRPLSLSQEQAINFAGFAFVMLLMVFVVVRDVSRFF